MDFGLNVNFSCPPAKDPNRTSGFLTPIQIDTTLQNFIREAGYSVGSTTNRNELTKIFKDHFKSQCQQISSNSRGQYRVRASDLMVQYFNDTFTKRNIDSDQMIYSDMQAIISAHIVK